MKAIICAAVALCPTLTTGQVIEVTTDRSVVDLSVPGGNEVMVSVTIDRQGYAEGAWADFEGWSYVNGYLVGNGGQFQLPVEHADDVNTGDWEGRRPPSVAGQGVGSNGGFRYPEHWGDEVIEGPGSLDWILQYSWAPDILSGWDTVLGKSASASRYGAFLDIAQALPQLGGFNQDRSERVEIYRARLTFDSPGTHEISFLPADCGFYDVPDLTHTVLGLEEVLSVMSVQVATVEARIPAPATLLTLGALPLMRRRR